MKAPSRDEISKLSLAQRMEFAVFNAREAVKLFNDHWASVDDRMNDVFSSTMQALEEAAASEEIDLEALQTLGLQCVQFSKDVRHAEEVGTRHTATALFYAVSVFISEPEESIQDTQLCMVSFLMSAREVSGMDSAIGRVRAEYARFSR